MLFQIAIVALLALTNAVQVKRGGDLCSVCVGVIGYVEGFVTKGEGLAEIEGEFDRVCPLFDSFQPECEGIVSEFLPAAIEYLENNDSPSQVCQKIALCSNQNNVVEDIVIPEEEEKPSVAAPAAGFCTICQTVVHYVEAYLEQNSTIAEIEQQLDQVCALTPFKSQCDTLVKNELPKIIHYIEGKATPKEICTRVGVCAQTLLLPVDNQVVEKKEEVAQVEAGGFCSVCEAIVGFVEHYVEQNSTLKHIEAQLDKACALTGAYEAECKALVHQYLPEIIHYVEKKESPAQICTRIGVCTKALASAILTLEAPKPKATNAGFCSVCKAIVGFVESYLEQNQTVKQIEAQLDQACALTGPYEAECKALVHQYLPEMIHYVEKKEPPAEVCARIGVCTKQASSELLELLPAAMSLQKAASKRNVGGLSGCLLCKTLVGYVEMYINRNETTANIEKKLHRFCKIVKKFEQECDMLIDTELEKIIKKLEAKESPDKVCDQLKACDDPTQAPQSLTPRVKQEAVKVPKSDPALCAVCEGIIAIGEHYAKNNKTVHEIEKELKKLCSYTGNYQMVCEGLVDTYVADIENYILSKATPAQVCETLHACTKPSFDALSLSANVGGPLTCKFCEVVHIVEEGLKSHETEHVIEQKLEKFCHLSKHFEAECDKLLEKDLGKVIAFLEKKEPPQKVCGHLHLCI